LPTARRHDLVPQQLSNWIKAAKDGRIALPADAMPSFVPVVVEPAQPNKAAHERRPVGIEIVIGTIKVRVPGGASTRDIEAVLRAFGARKHEFGYVSAARPDPGAGGD
jgi:transposase